MDERATRQGLVESLERLRAAQRTLDASGRSPAGAASPQYGKRSGDHIADALDHRRNVLARQNLEREAEALVRALAKVDDGTYGRCDRCGTPIAPERLEALPWASLCIDCKRKEEKPRR